jgi:hypothetical protein
MSACVALLLLAPSGCASHSSSAQQSGSPNSDTYPLWSDGWKAGDFEMLALTFGPFHASVKDGKACAWLGDGDTEGAVRWPAGYSIRLHPTVLLDPSGRVIAHEGDTVSGGGGTVDKTDADSPCGRPGIEIWDLQGGLSVTPAH